LANFCSAVDKLYFQPIFLQLVNIVYFLLSLAPELDEIY
jgi:hypothetical protein